MNKTIVTVAFIILGALAMGGAFTVLLVKPEATGQAVALVVTVLGIASSAVVTFYALGKQGEKLEQITKQTNGTLSALHAENTRLTNLISDQLPAVAAEALTSPVTTPGAHAAP